MEYSNLNVDINSFYNYGMGDLRKEINDDITIGLATEQRTQYYYRSYGVGSFQQENRPNTAIVQMLMKYLVMMFISRRNGEVTNGNNNTRDYRAVSSQSVINIEVTGDNKEQVNHINIEVPYITIFDMNSNNTAKVSIDL